MIFRKMWGVFSLAFANKIVLSNSFRSFNNLILTRAQTTFQTRLGAHYIISQEETDHATSHLSLCSEVSIDMEFDRDRYAYGTTLCLIQANGNGKTYIFDILSGINMNKFYTDILENSDILKIMHSPSEDIRIIQSKGYYPVSIYDTEKSAKLLDFQYTALGTIVKEILNISLDKSEQKSNWIKRPLTNTQIEYASLDVLYLSELKNNLNKLADEKGIYEWINEENLAWNQYRSSERNESNLVSKKDAEKLSPFEVFCYNELLKIRDKYAKLLNKPGHHVIPKQLLYYYSMTKNIHESIILNRNEVHPALRKSSVEKEFKSALKNAQIEATKLNLAKKFVNYKKDTTDELVIMSSEYPRLFKSLSDKYGKHAANYILPNRLIADLATNRINLNDVPFTYKKKLFLEILNKLA